MYTPILKNRTDGCHGNHAWFQSAIEFIFDDDFLYFCGPNKLFGTHKKCPGGASNYVPGYLDCGQFKKKNVCPTYARTNIRPDKAKSFNPST